MSKFTSESIIFVTVVGIILSLDPLSPVTVIRNFIYSSLPLLAGVLHLESMPILIRLHGLSAHWHIY